MNSPHRVGCSMFANTCPLAMKTALIVEDTPEAGAWMKQGLARVFPGIQSQLVESLLQARDLVSTKRFDLALIDLHLADGNGVELIDAINRSGSDTLCIVVTIYDDDQHLFPALQAGADGYLLKDMPDEQFIQRLQGIADGIPALSPAIARRLLGHFAAPIGAAQHHLTRRELEVLTLIAKGIRLSEVAQALAISPHTAGDYVKSIYRKLNISSRAEAATEATRLGLVNPR